MGDHRAVLAVATLGEGGRPNGQVVKARAVLALLERMGPLRTLQPRPFRRALRGVAQEVRRGTTLVVVLNRRGTWVVLVICALLRRLSRRRSRIVVVVVGGWMARLARRPWYARVIAVADDLLVESSRLEGELAAVGPRITRFPNFRDLSVDHRLVREPLGEAVRLCCAGRVRRDKGVLEAAALTQLLRSAGMIASLDVLGPIEDQEVVDELAGYAACAYLGEYDPEDVVDVLARYDFLVLASHYEGECQPGVVVEACFAGLPAIVSDWQDLPEMVDDGITGYVCPLNRFAEVASRRILRCAADGSLPDLSRAALDHAASDLTAYAARRILEPLILGSGPLRP